MISGKDWFESEYLVEWFNKCYREAIEDEELGTGEFEPDFERMIKRKIGQWTCVELEQKQLLEDMVLAAKEKRGTWLPKLE